MAPSWVRKVLLAARSLTFTDRRPLPSMWTGAFSMIVSSERLDEDRLWESVTLAPLGLNLCLTHTYLNWKVRASVVCPTPVCSIENA